jgi:hypothetical protein
MNATLYKKLNFNFSRDIAPVASIGGALYVMVVNWQDDMVSQYRTSLALIRTASLTLQHGN